MFRASFTRTIRQQASRRFMSTNQLRISRAQKFTPIAVTSAALATAFWYSSRPLSNDVDEAKVEADKKEAVEKAELENTSDEEEEEQGQAAFNPETGEINWDCPCLGGMADGPCGEEFKAAFSCFVYSESEPKGIDCIQKFEAMRNCFREHPEHYKEELYEDDEVVPATGEPTEAVVVETDIEVAEAPEVREVVSEAPAVEVFEVIETSEPAAPSEAAIANQEAVVTMATDH